MEKLIPCGIRSEQFEFRTKHEGTNLDSVSIVGRTYSGKEGGASAKWFLLTGMILPVDPSTNQIYPPASDKLERMYQEARQEEANKYAVSSDPTMLSRWIEELHKIRLCITSQVRRMQRCLREILLRGSMTSR